MIIIVNTKKENSLQRTTPSIFQKKKKKVRGYVDSVTNGIVVIIVRDSNNPDCIKEIYVPVSKFPKRIPEEGEYVTVTIEE